MPISISLPSALLSWLHLSWNRILAFAFGVILTLFLMTLVKSLKKQNKVEKEIVKFYLNIFVLNRKEVIKNKMKSKFSYTPVLAKVLAKVAGRMITDAKFSENIGHKLEEMIPVKLSEIGVKANVEMVFNWNSFVVIEVRILTADARKFIEKRAGKLTLI